MPIPSPIRIELPSVFGMKTVNAYLFLEPEPVLIDCGEKTEESWAALQKGLGAYGLQIKDIKKLVITHAHIDHMGAAGRICEESEAEVYFPVYGWDWAVNLDHMRETRFALIQRTFDEYKVPADTLLREIMGKLFGSFHHLWDPLPEDRLRPYQDGDILHMGGLDWQVLYVPGHCINQCCFYQAEQAWLMSADMVLSITPSPVIDPQLENPYQRSKGILQLLESYEKIQGLSIKTAFPGHYEPIEEVQKLIQGQVRRIHRRKKECLTLIQQGINQPYEIFEKMYGKNVAGWSMLIGYLDLLIQEKSIYMNSKNSIIEIS